MNLASAMYSGTLRHRRFTPIEHEFSYPVSLLYLDIDEISEVFSGFLRSAGPLPAPWWFRRRDYLGPASLSLRAAIQARIDRELTNPPDEVQSRQQAFGSDAVESDDATGKARSRIEANRHRLAHCGPIRLLTTVRNFGVGFNPISIYYCFDNDQKSLQTIVAEVTNTPWGRRHSYVIPGSTANYSDPIEHRFSKQLHVSPFNPMEVEYRWRCDVPDARAVVHLDARSIDSDSQAEAGDSRQSSVFFDATLNLERCTESVAQLRRSMLGQPFSSWSTLFRIYTEAYTLWRKGAPLHGNPHVADTNRDRL